MRENKQPKGKKTLSVDELIEAMKAAGGSSPQIKRTIRDAFKRRYERTIVGNSERWLENKAVFVVGLLFEQYRLLKKDFFIEFRGISAKQGPPKQEFILYDELEKHINDILSWNQKGYHVYFGVNPRSVKGKGKQDDIQDVVCLWLDIDAKNFQEGKPEAEKRIHEFQMKPNIIIDSGRGYHCYWVLQEPIINKTEAQGKEIKQILSGLATALGADKQTFNFDRLMRLPGTANLKDPENPKPCSIVQVNGEQFYSLADFHTFTDYHYEEPKGDDLDVGFKGETYIVSNQDSLSAIDGVKSRKLKVSERTKRMIMTGELQKESGADKTRSGRDMAIITSLVAGGYDYPTIKSIFLNPYLACSDRIREKSEQALKYDVAKARQMTQKERLFISPQIERIWQIKSNPVASEEEKLHAIARYIFEDLSGFCVLYKNDRLKTKYLFDRNQKMLMNIEDMDFESFIKKRYDLPNKDLKEVISTVRAEIYGDGQEITPYNFGRFEKDPGVLHISNHDNQTFRIDGQKITLVDNGTDGIIFEFRSDYSTINIDPAKLAGVNYFASGFDWKRFKEESLLFKHVIAKASFAREETHNLTVEDQQYLLSIYFFSLFFESELQEKPFICFKGTKASGKSFMGEAMGKILFGPAFLPSPLPDSKRDLGPVIGGNYYLCFDNLDSDIPSDILNDLCITATGGSFKNRVLYTNMGVAEIRPHIFISLTTRTPQFRRDDFTDRLIILNTEKIKDPKSRSGLFNEIMSHRGEIWNEILINLISIVRLLNEKRGWMPECIFRIADWDTFAQKIHGESGQERLKEILTKMNKEKVKFALEEDQAYIELKALVYDENGGFEDKSASEVYALLCFGAERHKNRDFSQVYKSSLSLARRLANIIEELNDEFKFKVREGRAHITYYSIGKKEGLDDVQAAAKAADIIKPETKSISVLEQMQKKKR